MTSLRKLIALIDRDVARWGGNPLATMIIGCLPMIVWGLTTGERPGDAPFPVLGLMLAPIVALGGLGIWRGGLHIWSEHKRVQALGEAEELEK